MLESPITKDEFISNLKKLKRGKANGPDSITNEMILEGGDSVHNAIISVFNSVLLSGMYPKEWRNNLILPI